MPPIVEVQVQPSQPEEAAKEGKDALPSRPTIGIIYPPPELRNIVDKTASFVARNGPEFEARIRQNEINNSKFNFLNPGDPYNAYYLHKVKEFKEGKGVAEPAVPAVPKPAIPVAKAPEIAKVEQAIVPKEPPPEFEFIVDPPSISALDLDIVKLTAQFVARNGRQFLTSLMNREQRNYQFDFLRPQHSLFNYFTKLLEQYTKILIPHKSLMGRMKRESENPRVVLDQVKYRVEWTKYQEAQKRKEEEDAERERVQYAQIDWHDFVVVETVDYQPNEQGLFPPPTTPEEVGTRVLAQQRLEEEGEEVEMEVESDEESEESDAERPASKVTDKKNQVRAESSSDEEEAPPRPPSPPPPPPKEAPPQPPPLPPNPEQVIVRKDYNPKNLKTQTTTSEQYLISPITGEKIPADKMQEHMRIGLLDPRWVEQRDRAMQEKMAQEEVYAPGAAIESSLKQFAERRTDIFGIGDEETAIGKKIGEEDKKQPEKVTWDGHTASMEAATRAARANITIEEQIQQIHKIKGLLPDEEKERIGPSKPQSSQPPLPPNMPISTSASESGSSTSIMSGSAPPLPPTPPKQSQPPPPPTPPSRPPPPVAVPPPPGAPIAIIPATRPVLIPAPSIIMAPPGTAPGLQPPPTLIAIPRPPPMATLAPRPPFAPSIAPVPMPPGQPQPEPPGGLGDDEPPSKKQKTEESLVPEEEFLQKNKNPVTFKVQVPNLSEKPEWKLNGQVLSLTLPLTDMISVIKAKLHEQVGMPPGKQKLQYEGMFIKDSNSLAFYNVTPGSVISLQLKERGGRKK